MIAENEKTEVEMVANGFADVFEACRYLRVSRATLYKLLGKELKFAKVGRSVRIPWSELYRYAKKCLAETAAEQCA